MLTWNALLWLVSQDIERTCLEKGLASWFKGERVLLTIPSHNNTTTTTKKKKRKTEEIFEAAKCRTFGRHARWSTRFVLWSIWQLHHHPLKAMPLATTVLSQLQFSSIWIIIAIIVMFSPRSLLMLPLFGSSAPVAILRGNSLVGVSCFGDSVSGLWLKLWNFEFFFFFWMFIIKFGDSVSGLCLKLWHFEHFDCLIGILFLVETETFGCLFGLGTMRLLLLWTGGSRLCLRSGHLWSSGLGSIWRLFLRGSISWFP